MADKKHKGKADITPILESFSKMTNYVNNTSQNTTQKSPREDVCDQNIEQALEQATQKLTPGLQVKRSGGIPPNSNRQRDPRLGKNTHGIMQKTDNRERIERHVLKTLY